MRIERPKVAGEFPSLAAVEHSLPEADRAFLAHGLHWSLHDSDEPRPTQMNWEERRIVDVESGVDPRAANDDVCSVVRRSKGSLRGLE